MSTMPNNPQKIDEALSSLDNVQRAKAPAFFYTRLRGRMERELENAGGPLVRMLTRPVLTLTLAAIILILNATTVLEMWHQDKAVAAADNTQQLIAAEYPMGSYPVYDETPATP